MKTIAKIIIAVIIAYVLIQIFRVMFPLIAGFLIFLVFVAGIIYIWNNIKRYI